MLAKPGDSVFCIEAPWHDENSQEPCGIRNYGPRVDEPVTVDFLLEDEYNNKYYRLKEYPDHPDDPSKFAAFRQIFFMKLDDIKIEQVLTYKIYDTD